MNSHQRRTVRRAKDARRPYGRAVERERRKAKRARRGRTTGWLRIGIDAARQANRDADKLVSIEFDGRTTGTMIIDHPSLDGTFLKIEDGKPPVRIDFDAEGREVPYPTRDGEATIL